jgi:hypothetical protein
MTTMKERISNVIAWLGFGCLLILPLGFGGLAYDQFSEKPLLIGEVQSCREIQRSTNANLKAAYSHLVDLEECSLYKNYAARWSYKGVTFGLTADVSWRINRLGYGIDIPGYTHNVGTDLSGLIIPWALPLWLISVVLNYILFGSARLLPWKRAVISEETQ